MGITTHPMVHLEFGYRTNHTIFAFELIIRLIYKFLNIWDSHIHKIMLFHFPSGFISKKSYFRLQEVYKENPFEWSTVYRWFHIQESGPFHRRWRQGGASGGIRLGHPTKPGGSGAIKPIANCQQSWSSLNCASWLEVNMQCQKKLDR